MLKHMHNILKSEYGICCLLRDFAQVFVVLGVCFQLLGLGEPYCYPFHKLTIEYQVVEYKAMF